MATGRQRSSSQAEYFLKKSILEYKENKEGFLLKIRICTDRKPFLKNKNVANSIMGSFTPTRVRLVKVLQGIGPAVSRPYARRLECLIICRCQDKCHSPQ